MFTTIEMGERHHWFMMQVATGNNLERLATTEISFRDNGRQIKLMTVGWPVNISNKYANSNQLKNIQTNLNEKQRGH